MSEQKYTDEEWKKIQEFIKSPHVQNFLNGKGYYPRGLQLPPSLMGVISEGEMNRIVSEYDKLRREQNDPFKTWDGNIFDVLRERIESKEPDSNDGKGGNKVEITKKFLEEPNLNDGKGGNKIDGNKIGVKVGKTEITVDDLMRFIEQQKKKEAIKKRSDIYETLKKREVPEEPKTTEQNKDRNKGVNNTYVQKLGGGNTK